LLKENVCVAVIAASMMLLSACSSSESPDSTSKPPAEPIQTDHHVNSFRGVPVKYDVYDDITRIGDETLGYALYTYVLMPVEAKAGSLLEMRYKSLMREIKATTISLESADYFPKRESNIFYLPAGNALQRHTFSLQLIAHLHRLGNQTVNTLLPTSSPGPFLVSIQQPVLGMNRHTNLLIADLSSTNKSAFPEVIAAYKNRLKHGGIDDTANFESLRLSLLNFIFNANDNLHLVKKALADWQ